MLTIETLFFASMSLNVLVITLACYAVHNWGRTSGELAETEDLHWDTSQQLVLATQRLNKLQTPEPACFYCGNGCGEDEDLPENHPGHVPTDLEDFEY